MQKYLCKNCGAELYWDADAGALKCEYCGHSYQPSDFGDASLSEEPIASEEVDKEYTTTAQDIGPNMVVYKCTHCNAEVVADKNTVATVCPYCGSALSITSKIMGEFRPEVVLPFGINKDKATQLYKDYISKTQLTPKEFRSNRVIQKIQGMYVPYYLTSEVSRGDAIFECDRIASTRRGYDRIVNHQIYEVNVVGKANFENVPSDASQKLDDKFMDSVEPFDYRNLQQFNPGYMAGFIADNADVDKEEVIQRNTEKIKKGLTTLLEGEVGHWNAIVLKRLDYKHAKVTHKYAMLPIWIFSEPYKDKVYTFAVNGVTGKVVGKLPISTSVLLTKFGIATGIAFGLLSIILPFIA